VDQLVRPRFIDAVLTVYRIRVVWSMPGGFTSAGREGYQTVDEESSPQYRPKPPQSGPPKLASSPPQAAPSAGPGAYQAA
jgi:hypothetical protein